MSSKCNHRVLIEGREKVKGKQRQYEDRSRVWSDVPMSQGTPRQPVKAGKGKE